MTTQMKKGRPADFGKGVYIINEEQLVDLAGGDADSLQIAKIVKEILDSDEYEPPILPEVALSLTQMANKPDVDFHQVEKVVSKDPLVAAKIVAVANSAFYSRGQPVRSLGLAIARLGLAAVRDVAFQVVAQTTIFKVAGYANRMRELYSAAQLAFNGIFPMSCKRPAKKHSSGSTGSPGIRPARVLAPMAVAIEWSQKSSMERAGKRGLPVRRSRTAVPKTRFLTVFSPNRMIARAREVTGFRRA